MPDLKINTDEILILVNQIISLKNRIMIGDIQELEYEIDQLAYKLYGFVPEEIAIVEGAEI